MLRAIQHCSTAIGSSWLTRSQVSMTTVLPVCAACLQLQRLGFHTTAAPHAAKAKNAKRKLVKPVHFKPKGIKADQGLVAIRPDLTVQEIAARLNKDVDHVFEVMLYISGTDRYDQPDSVIDNLTVIKDIVRKSGFKFHMEAKKTHKPEKEIEDATKRPPPDPVLLQPRPPVVTIMGHVDHGKTTLLDSLRHSHVVDREFGGITQHIGAFAVALPSGEKITFLDTPGHAAFHHMRARGAHVTDIVVLVVAADDGVMKQTVESIKHAQDAKVPVIVAINKTDKKDADIEGTKEMLLREGIQLEDFGGDVQAVPISALQGTNLDQLQDAILALSEVLEVRGDPTGPVEGSVVESRTDTGRGKLATALVQRGTLRKGAVLVAGTAWAKVRGMFNDQGQPVQEVRPGMPVEVIGWRDLPSAGDEIIQVESEKRAHEVINWRKAQLQQEKILEDQRVIQAKFEEHQREYRARRQARLDMGHRRGALYRKERTKEVQDVHSGPEFAVVIKGDVDGSVEAILDALDTYHSDQCRLHMVQYGVGDVAPHDVEIAAAFNGIVYGFNVTVTDTVKQLARSKGVEIRRHNVIYRMMDDLKEEISSRLQTVQVEEVLGEAQVLQHFTVTDGKKKLPVAGCRCVKGLLQKKARFRLIRNDDVLIDGPLSSLKHFKSEVDSIKTNVECGICFDDTSIEPQAGDTVVCYNMKETEQQLDWDLNF